MQKMEEFFEKLSFRTRFRLGVVLVILLVTTVGTMVSIYRQGQDQCRAMNELGRYIAMNLSEKSALAILSKDKSNLEYSLKVALGEHQVAGISVYAVSGKLIGSMQREDYLLSDFEVKEQRAIASSAKEDVVIVETTSRAGTRLRSYFAKVLVQQSMDKGEVFTAETKQGRFCGFVRVDFSLAELLQRKLAVMRQNLFLMPLYILIGILFSMAAEYYISKPLRRLKSAATAVSKGDFSQQVPVGAKDDIGLLSETFNNMSGKLSKTISDLNYSNQQLEQINNELQDFTYGISHDLQEPLRKVHSFGQFLTEDCYEQLSDDGKDYIERMQKASLKMKNLIEDLLRLSRIGTSETSFVPVNTNEIVKSALDDLSVSIAESQAEINVEQLPDVVGQGTLLTQLFENLIGNALKYRDTEKTAEIHISAVRQNGRVTFAVKDNGIGIEERFLEKIFGVFQRLHSNGYKGTGIGLALCKKIVSRHGGMIWAESTAGEGSEFKFTLKSHNN